MSETYKNEINKRKAKNFFLGVLKKEGRIFVTSDSAVEGLAELLTKKLLEKLRKETK